MSVVLHTKLILCFMTIALVNTFAYINLNISIDQQNFEALENKPYKLYSYSPDPRAEVCCFRLNFDIPKLLNSLLIRISPSLATSSMAPPPATLPGFFRHEPEIKEQVN